MKALVLAAGFGTRLKEIIHDRPKVMAPIGNKPFLEFVLQNLAKNDISEVVIATGYLADYISDYFGDGGKFGLKINYSYQPVPIGTGGAVKLAESQKFFDETYFVVNGDTLIETNLKKIWDYHHKKKAQITIAIVKRREVTESGVVKLNRAGQITSFIEKSKRKRGAFVNCGVYVFNPGAVSIIKREPRFSLEKDVFPRLAQMGKLYGFQIQEDFVDIGTPENYYKVYELLSKKEPKVIEVVAPARISFAGGGTDLPEYFQKFGGVVLSGAIQKFAHVRIKILSLPQIRVKLADFGKEEVYPQGKILSYDGSAFDFAKAAINKFRPATGCEITVWGDFPPGSGLGSSSAVTVALIHGLFAAAGKKITKDKLARLAIELEREELQIPGGWQDQHAAAFGGLNFIEFKKTGKVKISPLNLGKKALKELEDNLLLCYLGGKRSEAGQQKFLSRNIKTDKTTLETLAELKEITHKMKSELKAGNLKNFAQLLHQGWLNKKKTSRVITTKVAEKIYKIALKKGALGGKLLGAGGGGYLLLFVPKRVKEQLITHLGKYAIGAEPVNFDLAGPTVRIFEKNEV